MDLFNELYLNYMKYAKSKGNTWEYVYCKILQVFGVEYFFSHPKEEESAEPIPPSNANDKNEKKEEEKKKEREKGEKKEESKEGEEPKKEEKRREKVKIKKKR